MFSMQQPSIQRKISEKNVKKLPKNCHKLNFMYKMIIIYLIWCR